MSKVILFPAVVCLTVIAGAAIAQEMPWQIQTATDPITDKMTASAYIVSGKDIIGIKCDEAGPEAVYIHFVSKKYLGRSNSDEIYGPVIYRFDSDEPIKSSWYYSSHSTGLFKDAANIFVKRLVTAKKLAIRAYAYDYSSVDVVFNLPSNPAPIREVYAKCGQDFPD